jgi:hypothetical protein
LEVVGVEPQVSVELIKKSKLLIVIVAIVADALADNGVVFLFDVTAIVLAERTASGEGDFGVFAEAEEVAVDELRAIIGVEAEHGKGEFTLDVMECLQDPHQGFSAKSARFGPSCGNIGGIQGLEKVAVTGAAVVGY